MTESSVRGAARSKGGATDTTMLIWKVIAASPGITRPDIWERVEHSIPEGYAIRLYSRAVEVRKTGRIADTSAIRLDRARRYILTHALAMMRYAGIVTWEGEGADGRRYAIAREIDYKGNAEAVDETGTKAAEHMAVADALSRVERLLATGSAVQKYGRKNYEAMAVLVKALRAKDRAVS